MNWYVVFVRGGMEEKIKDFLLNEQIDAFLPKQEVIYRKEGKATVKEKLMFPSYIFIETADNHIDFHERLRNLKSKKSGIIKELKYDNEGTSALTKEEQKLLERLIGRKKVMKHSIGFIENDEVIITEGPLEGLESRIVKIDRHKRRAELEIEMLGQIRKLSVSLEIIDKK